MDEGSVRVVGQGCIRGGKIDWNRVQIHECHGDARKLKGFLEPGDVLVNSTGRGTLGRVGYFKGNAEGPVIADSHITLVRVDRTKLDPRFLYYYLSSSSFQRYLFSHLVSGATNQIELSPERMGAATIPLPPLEDQRRVAAFLDTQSSAVERGLAACRELRGHLLERRASGVHASVSGSGHALQRASSLPWVRSLPEVWTETKINFVARMGSGHTPSRSRPEWWVDCTIPWVTTGEVADLRDDRREVIETTREKLSLLGIANSSAEIHPAGTVVLSRTASPGFSGIMGAEMATSQDFVTWTCGRKINPYYLLWCLRAMRPHLLGYLATGSTHKTMYVPDLQALKIPLPPFAEQNAIVGAIEASNRRVDNLIDATARQEALVIERQQALITAVVTGQVDVSTARLRDV